MSTSFFWIFPCLPLHSLIWIPYVLTSYLHSHHSQSWVCSMIFPLRIPPFAFFSAWLMSIQPLNMTQVSPLTGSLPQPLPSPGWVRYPPLYHPSIFCSPHSPYVRTIPSSYHKISEDRASFSSLCSQGLVPFLNLKDDSNYFGSS